MRITTNILCLALLAMLVAASGCSKSKPPGADAATLQGTWTGLEAANESQGSPSLVLSGSTLEFHGANTNEWYKATFTLHEDTKPKQLVAVITDCAAPQYVGKTANAIYQLENGTLTIAAFEPGNPSVPPDFDAQGSRKVVLKAK